MNKRYLTIESIKDKLNTGFTFKDIFKADAIIFLDKFASDVYKMYQNGMSEIEVKNQIKNWNI
jgi:hypothetical protein